MSIIGKKPVIIPNGVTVTLENGIVSVKGPKGTLGLKINQEISVKQVENGLLVEKIGKTKQAPAIWGTTTRLLGNLIKGVTEGFQKQLELNGVGYRMAVQGKKITMALGFSHPVEVSVVDGIEVKIEGNVLTVSGIDKQLVGQFAANIKDLKPVEPYKGKGFRYVGEIVRRKEGKKATASA